jgi:hypothetical protein
MQLLVLQFIIKMFHICFTQVLILASEVGYTPAMPRREDHEVHKGQVVALKKKSYYINRNFNIIKNYNISIQ